ncbi:MAG: redoxin domain-containing protein [Bacteroidales bacterium]|nr:redoxin domain-containing protein [Bacteroidales bacterium]
MKRFVSLLAAAILITACNTAPTAQITVNMEGAADSAVVLQKLNYNRLMPVDTIRTDEDGQFVYKVRLIGNEPYFYYLTAGGKPVASMILLPKDRVTINIPAAGPFEVEGSEESSLLKQVNETFAAAADRMNALASSITEDSPDEEVKAVNRDMSKLYVDYKRQAIRYVVEHPRSITSAVVLFQRFNENLPVFGQESDAVIIKSVQDSLAKVYPKSEFLLALRDELTARANNMQIASQLDGAVLLNHPELSLPDVEGKTRALSELDGKVIILSFWSVAQTEHKMFNVDLIDLYRKYHDRGLEVYQVSLDVDKPQWAATVNSQGIPWISVNDGLGVDSPSVLAYNVNRIPQMFIIDRAGDIVANDIFDKDGLEKQIAKCL